MCKLVEDFKDLNILAYTGYKVAIRIDGKYYSPVTGIEYKIGPVEIPEKIEMLCYDFVDVLRKDYPAYQENMVGRTCVLTDYDSALKFSKEIIVHNEGSVVILKMCVSKDLMVGYYCNCLVVGGKEILFMREI